MASEKVQQKLAQMKKIRKILAVITTIAACIGLAALVVFNFADVCNLTVEGTDKFGNGFDYPGWQLIYYGIGIQYIPGYYEFGFNIWTCLGMFVPILAVVICSAMFRSGKNRKKAVLEFVMAGSFVFGGLILVNCTKLAVLVASNEGMNSFKDAYLLPAIEAGTFTLSLYPKILCVILLVVAAIKIANGIFLLYQKSYADKNK